MPLRDKKYQLQSNVPHTHTRNTQTHMSTRETRLFSFRYTHLEYWQQAQITEADCRFPVLRQGPSRGGNVNLLHELVEDLEPDHIVVVRRLVGASR